MTLAALFAAIKGTGGLRVTTAEKATDLNDH
jgi:hypothetical protein